MFSTICLLTLLAFLLWMNTSVRIAKDKRSGIAVYFSERPLLSSVLSCVLFIAALLMSLYLFGTLSGVFVTIVVLMTIGGLAVLLMPLRYISLWQLGIVYIVSLFLEILVS